MLNERLTQCECPAAGFCERHKCEKNQYLFEMCRRSAAWYQLWEQGRGPGQRASAHPPPPSRDQCRHRGLQTRTETCPTCRETVQIKVFSCAEHGECALSAKLPTVISCVACDDYQTD